MAYTPPEGGLWQSLSCQRRPWFINLNNDLAGPGGQEDDGYTSASSTLTGDTRQMSLL